MVNMMRVLQTKITPYTQYIRVLLGVTWKKHLSEHMGIAWKKMGKKFTHPHLWIGNEDG